MATSYTDILKLALPTQGELSGTWGTTVNDNITKMIEERLGSLTKEEMWEDYYEEEEEFLEQELLPGPKETIH